jgi:hypothetical protein
MVVSLYWEPLPQPPSLVFLLLACSHIHASRPGILFGLDTKLIATLKLATLNRKSWYSINLFPVCTNKLDFCRAYAHKGWLVLRISILFGPI